MNWVYNIKYYIIFKINIRNVKYIDFLEFKFFGSNPDFLPNMF